MEYAFSPDEITELAAKVEEKGAEFYRHAAALVSDAETQSIFETLAGQEIEHKETFLALGDEIEDAHLSQMYDIDLHTHMKDSFTAMLQKAAFNSEQLAGDAFDSVKALDLAIQIYTRIQDAFVARFRVVIARILTEEQKHFAILSDLRSKL